MQNRVPDDFIAQLRERVDIVDVVSEHVRLTRSGRSLIGLCPFHSEKTPSFHVTPGKGFYHCFGCGVGGTAINFLMEIEQLTFREAVEHLAQRAGLQMPSLYEEPNDLRSERRAQLLHAHDLAGKFYNHIVMNMDAGTQGLSYFLHRGLTKKTIAQFMLGFAPKTGKALLAFLSKRGIAREVLIEAGLCVETDRGELVDRFRGRVMFPVWDLQGRIIAFGARTIGADQPKYLNSPETPLFVKGRSLYGYHRARQAIRQTGKVLLLEGYMDVLALQQAGVHHAVAGLGTALTPEQAGLLHRVAETVVLMYDGDEAGQNATQKSLDVCREVGAAVRIAVLPEGVDPDEWIQTRGVDAFRTQIIEATIGALEFELRRLTRAHPNHLTSGRIAYLNAAVDVIAKENSAIEREAAMDSLAKSYAISPSALRDDVQKIISKAARAKEDHPVMRRTAGGVATTHPASMQAGTLPEKHVVAARQLLTVMMLDASVARRVQESCPVEFPGPLASALQAYLYTFYEEHEQADAEWFVSSLDDPQLVHFAADLLRRADDLSVDSTVRDNMVADFIDCLISYDTESTVRKVEEQMKVAAAAADYAALSDLQTEFLRLREGVKNLGKLDAQAAQRHEWRIGR